MKKQTFAQRNVYVKQTVCVDDGKLQENNYIRGNKLKRNIALIIFIGFSYSLMMGIIVQICSFANINDFILGLILLHLLPFLYGSLVLLFLKKTKYSNAIYYSSIIAVYYLLVAIENILVLPSMSESIQITLSYLKNPGIFSFTFFILGAIFAITINRIRFNCDEEKLK